jgi:hypothetical protein
MGMFGRDKGETKGGIVAFNVSINFLIAHIEIEFNLCLSGERRSVQQLWGMSLL